MADEVQRATADGVVIAAGAIRAARAAFVAVDGEGDTGLPPSGEAIGEAINAAQAYLNSVRRPDLLGGVGGVLATYALLDTARPRAEFLTGLLDAVVLETRWDLPEL